MSLFESPGWLTGGSIFQRFWALPLPKLFFCAGLKLPEVCTLAVTSLHRLSGAVFDVKGMG